MLVWDIQSGMERVSREEGNLLYLIEDEAMRLKSELRATCPEFRAWEKGWEKDLEKLPSVTPLPELLLERELPAPGRTRKVIYLDEVLSRKTRYAVTVRCVIPPPPNRILPYSSAARGLPDGGQHEVAEEYLKSFTGQWDGPTNQFITKATGFLRTFIHTTIDARCGHYLNGGLPSHMRYGISI